MDKDTIRVASVAMHSVMGNPSANLGRVAEWAHKAHAQGANFAIFPEECITGSMNKSDLTFEEARKIAAAAAEESMPFLESLARKLQMTLVVGTIEPFDEQLRNSALIVGPEGYLATFSKLHLPNPNEREWFVPGDTFPVVASQGWTFGVGICYDLRFPELFRGAAQKGAELFFIPVGGSGATKRFPITEISVNKPNFTRSWRCNCCRGAPLIMPSTSSTRISRGTVAMLGFPDSAWR